MSSRRLARAKRSPSFNLGSDDNPNHVHQRSFEHPIFGKVRLWIIAGRIKRLMWSAQNQGQNVHTRHNNPQKFAEILQELGIDP